MLCFSVFLSQAVLAQPSTGSPASSTAVTNTGMTKKSATNNSQTAQFKVWGNCGMCKKTIEKAATKVKGVETAEWDMDTHQFSATFNPSKTSVDKIHRAIAKAGYDTDQQRGNDKAYNNLPGCCQYDRRN